MNFDTKNHNHNEINPKDFDLEPGFTSLIARVILEAINDLGIDALQDEGTQYWIAEATNVNQEVLHHAVATMPTKNGKADAKPGIRHIMEQLDAKDGLPVELAEIEIHFNQIPLADMAEPTKADLDADEFFFQEIQAELAAEAEAEAEAETWEDNWKPDWK